MVSIKSPKRRSRSRKPCKSNQVKNRSTGRCRNKVKSKRRSPKRRSRSRKPCKSNQARNRSTGRCRNKVKSKRRSPKRRSPKRGSRLPGIKYRFPSSGGVEKKFHAVNQSLTIQDQNRITRNMREQAKRGSKYKSFSVKTNNRLEIVFNFVTDTWLEKMYGFDHYVSEYPLGDIKSTMVTHNGGEYKLLLVIETDGEEKTLTWPLDVHDPNFVAVKRNDQTLNIPYNDLNNLLNHELVMNKIRERIQQERSGSVDDCGLDDLRPIIRSGKDFCLGKEDSVTYEDIDDENINEALCLKGNCYLKSTLQKLKDDGRGSFLDPMSRMVVTDPNELLEEYDYETVDEDEEDF